MNGARDPRRREDQNEMILKWQNYSKETMMIPMTLLPPPPQEESEEEEEEEESEEEEEEHQHQKKTISSHFFVSTPLPSSPFLSPSSPFLCCIYISLSTDTANNDATHTTKTLQNLQSNKKTELSFFQSFCTRLHEKNT
mmetsp:Transcript_36115/g.52914  ORF Transcript_36115/g.52914 Transcript_36115/m.52914 type:complete len:139 (+) Transcript_36115:346-762(+)